MSAVLITYDLNAPGQRYEEVHTAIKALGPWWHYLDSTWIVVTPLLPSQVFEQLRPATDATDRFLILNITNDTYSGWLTDEAWEWIRKNV